MRTFNTLGFLIVSLALILTIPLAAIAQTAVPMLISYQGELRSPATGQPVPDGNYEMLFRIYGTSPGGVPLWTEEWTEDSGLTVSVTNGRFSVLLGRDRTLPASVFSGPHRYLEIAIKSPGGLETLTPRQTITSVPYALVAIPPSNTGTSNDPILSVRNLGAGYALLCYADSSYAIRGDSDGENGRGVHGEARGANGYGVSGYAYGENGRGVVGIASQIDWVENYGGYFEAAGAMGRGVYGLASATGSAKNYGGYFEANGDSGIGVVAKGADAGVLCQGDLVVANDKKITCTGDIDCWGLISCKEGLTVAGAYTGSFPRPAYDSGWMNIDKGQELVLQHNLGGKPDNYLVDLQFKDIDEGGVGVNQVWYGGDHSVLQILVGLIPVWKTRGACWRNLTQSQITVKRWEQDEMAEQVRVRIWVCR